MKDSIQPIATVTSTSGLDGDVRLRPLSRYFEDYIGDEGDYMFSSYSGKWIPDSREIRRNITQTLRFWNPPSDSSPVEGITEAINTFYTPDRKISIYVFWSNKFCSSNYWHYCISVNF